MSRRKGKKKLYKLSQVMIRTVKEMTKSLKYGIIEELDKIATLIQILVPILILKITDDVVIMIVLSTLFAVFIKYIKEVGYKLNNVTERGFPLPLHRFTKQNEQGFIDIEDEDMEQAILYLCDVEEYLKKKGLL